MAMAAFRMNYMMYMNPVHGADTMNWYWSGLHCHTHILYSYS